MDATDPSSTEKPQPAEVVQGIGPLFTPPYVYVMFPVAVLAALLIVPLLPVGGGGGPFAMLVPLLILGALSLLGAVGSLWPMRLVIGNDGVHVSWLFIDNYISYRDLAEVQVHRSARSRGIMFVTRKGRRIPVPLQMHVISVGPKTEKLEHITSLLERIGCLAIPIAERVNHEDRGASDGRGADHAMAVVVDAGECWQARAEAAMALGPLDDVSKARLRDLAASTANPKLRQMFEAAAEGRADR
jgi:hypothetical protein